MTFAQCRYPAQGDNMDFTPIQRHYQRFEVAIVTQQAPNRPSTLTVGARSAKNAVEAVVANPEGRYDWIRITCENETSERSPHRGGSRQ